MADMAAGIDSNASLPRRESAARTGAPVHPAWQRLMRYCADLAHGEIEKLKIQDGLPVAAEVTTRKVKFSP
jgi:hypothetical protein